MRSRPNQILVSVFIAVLLANVAAPGLLMHNCRQFGTRSTQLCACCKAEQESSGSCCSKKSEAVATAAHSETAIESACCFMSIEAPFSFEGLSGSTLSVSAPVQDELVGALPRLTCEEIAPDGDAFSHSALRIRHSSDPPSYILTHSFRC